MSFQQRKKTVGGTDTARHVPAPGPAWPELFCLEVRERRDHVVVGLIGELDLAIAGAVEHELRNLVKPGMTQVVLDLRGVSFMDSSALHVLVRARSRAVETSGRVDLKYGSGQVKRLLELTGLDRSLESVGPAPAVALGTPTDGGGL